MRARSSVTEEMRRVIAALSRVGAQFRVVDVPVEDGPGVWWVVDAEHGDFLLETGDESYASALVAALNGESVDDAMLVRFCGDLACDFETSDDVRFAADRFRGVFPSYSATGRSDSQTSKLDSESSEAEGDGWSTLDSERDAQWFLGGGRRRCEGETDFHVG